MRILPISQPVNNQNQQNFKGTFFVYVRKICLENAYREAEQLLKEHAPTALLRDSVALESDSMATKSYYRLKASFLGDDDTTIFGELQQWAQRNNSNCHFDYTSAAHGLTRSKLENFEIYQPSNGLF